jgi:hypothetical protein
LTARPTAAAAAGAPRKRRESDRTDAVGVGSVGLSVGGWAARAHVPVLRAIPGYEIRAGRHYF